MYPTGDDTSDTGIFPVIPPKKGKALDTGVFPILKKKEVGGVPSQVGGEVGTSVHQSQEGDNVPDQYGRTGWMKNLPDAPTQFPGSTDPLNDALSVAHNKLSQAKGMTGLERFQHERQANKEIKTVLKGFDNGSQAKGSLDKIIGDDSDKYSIDQLEKGTPKTLTGMRALSAVKDKRKVDDAINTSKDLGKAATKYVTGKDEAEDKLKEGEHLQTLLNNPNTIQRAKSDPEFAKKYKDAETNFYTNYKEAASKQLAQEIGQEMEDNGDANWLYNNPGKEKVDGVVDRMVKSGKWTEQKRTAYKDILREDLGTLKSYWSGSPIPTKDLTNDVSRGVKEGGEYLFKGALDISQMMQGGSLYDLPANKQIDAIAEKIRKEKEAMPQIEGTSWYSKHISSGAGFLGFAAPMILGGMAGVPALALSVPQFEGLNSVEAHRIYGDDKESANIYTILMTTADAITFGELPVGEAGKTIKNLLSKEIRGTIDDYAAKKITSEEARDIVQGKLNDAIESFGVGSGKGGGILTLNQLAHNGINAAFGQRDFNAGKEAKQALESLPENIANISFVSGIASAGKLLGQTPKPQQELTEPILETKTEERTPEQVISDLAEAGNSNKRWPSMETEMVAKGVITPEQALLEFAKQKHGITDNGTELEGGGRDIAGLQGVEVDKAVSDKFPSKQSVIDAIKPPQETTTETVLGEDWQNTFDEHLLKNNIRETLIYDEKRNRSHKGFSGGSDYGYSVLEGETKEAVLQKLKEHFSSGKLKYNKHKELVEYSLEEGKYQKAIAEGVMSASRAKEIIESVGLKAPKEITEQTTTETVPKEEESDKVKELQAKRDEIINQRDNPPTRNVIETNNEGEVTGKVIQKPLKQKDIEIHVAERNKEIEAVDAQIEKTKLAEKTKPKLDDLPFLKADEFEKARNSDHMDDLVVQQKAVKQKFKNLRKISECIWAI